MPSYRNTSGKYSKGRYVASRPGKIKGKKISTPPSASRPIIFRLAVAGAGLLLVIDLLLWHWVLFQHVVLPRPDPAHTPADAVAVLTGSAGRITAGAALWQSGRARRLLIIGAHPAATTAAIMQAGGITLGNGTDQKAVVVEHRSYNTRTNMVELRRICRRLQIKSLIIVTSAFHERRACLLARSLLPPDLTVAFQPAAGGSSGCRQLREFIKYLAALPHLLLAGESPPAPTGTIRRNHDTGLG